MKILLGDALEMLKTLDAESVQCCVTSPPYYGLRDYGIERQIGLEETPEVYVEKLVIVFREVRRVLKNDGTLWLNLGDSYWGGKGQSAHGDPERHIARMEAGITLQKPYQEIGHPGWTAPKDGKHEIIKPKDLCGIPWRVAFALQADGWWLRSDIIWNKPNPMPESVTDRPTKSHEYIFLLAKSQKYYYDAEAIKEKGAEESIARYGRNSTYNGSKPYSMKQGPRGSKYSFSRSVNEEPPPGKENQHRPDREDIEYSGTRNKRTVWTVTTKPYSGAHFATFPPALIEPCILAGSKQGDIILDPFNGSGTTGAVAIKHRRDYIGIELNPSYIELSNKRLEKLQIVMDLE
jgi:DNA modification methylase